MKSSTFLSVICIILTVFILMMPDLSIATAMEAVHIWQNSIFPSLFPFFVMTSIIKQTGIIENILYKSSRNLDYNLLFITIIGLICGYPSTSKLIGQSDTKNPISIYALSTAPSPVFIIGSISSIFLGNGSLALYLLPATYLSLLTSFIIIRAFDHDKAAKKVQKPSTPRKPIGDMLTTAILDGMKSQAIILGIIITVSIFCVFLEKVGIFFYLSIILAPIARLIGMPISTIQAFLKGLLEMTTGVYAICTQNISLHHKLILCGFITSFGGMSIILESLAFINNKIKAISIIGVKAIHGCFTAIYLRLLLYIFPVYQETAIMPETKIISNNSAFIIASIIALLILSILHQIAHLSS